MKRRRFLGGIGAIAGMFSARLGCAETVMDWTRQKDGTFKTEIVAEFLPGAKSDCKECHGTGWSTPEGCLSGLCETCFEDAPEHMKIPDLNG